MRGPGAAPLRMENEDQRKFGYGGDGLPPDDYDGDDEGWEPGGDGGAPSQTGLFILLGALVLIFLGIAVIVILIQRKAGGTKGAGFQRALHFITYVVILLQTTMFCSSAATREVVSGANNYFRTDSEGDAAWRAIAEAVGKFYAALNVFQLDFSDAMQLSCLDGSQFVMDTVRRARGGEGRGR